MRITEKWIREKIQYDGENLEDIKSLALPGSYKDKITHLGTSLLHFSRLKELDLSRNALISLDGIEHLEQLEILNLYFNQIATLEEIYKLRSNVKLKELDIRLNPLGRNEPDYRLYLVHMLPSLRTLDDRPIQDDERRAAVMNFSSDAAREFSRPSDTQLHRLFTSVEKIIPNSNSNNHEFDEATSIQEAKNHPRVAQVDKWKMFRGDSLPLTISTPQIICTDYDTDKQTIGKTSSSFSSDNHRENQQMKIQVYERSSDEGGVDMHTKSFNEPKPFSDPPPRTSTLRNQKVSFSFNSNQNNHKSDEITMTTEKTSLSNDTSREEINSKACISQICDLVDRYWNGRKSLHTHPKFLPSALAILQNFMEHHQLMTRANQTRDDKSLASASRVNRELVDELQKKLNEVKFENQQLFHELNKKKREASTATTTQQRELEKNGESVKSTTAYLPSASLVEEASGGDSERIRQEMTSMRVKLRALEQMADMAQMLKESHKSLVATNRQLMIELKEARNTTGGSGGGIGGVAYHKSDIDESRKNSFPEKLTKEEIDSPRGFSTYDGKSYLVKH